MSVQNDNTLVTKGDLKSLYTDKIAPYLGGGISYYYTDRTGEELRNVYAMIDSNWTAVLNTNIPFIKQTGSFIQPSTGLFTIPVGVTVEIICSLSAYPVGDASYALYNNTDGAYLDSFPILNPFTSSSTLQDCTGIFQWTNTLDHNVDISLRCKAISATSTIEKIVSSLSIKEIGRIVDPVKYVSNNSDLEETPVGNIISYMGNSVPKHYLACDGTIYAIGSYPELEQFIINEFGSINYFGGNGSSTWAVPDLRGEFLRGTGSNSHINQGSGANVGTHQDATEHRNLMSGPKSWTNIYFENADGDYAGAVNPDSNTQHRDASNSAKVDFNSISGDYSTTHYTARPTNTSVQYCIKYESTFHAFFSNAAYKVSVAASVAASSAVQLIFDSSDIIGDSSLISGNSLVAPMDGWYSLGMNWSQSGSGDIGYYIRINGASGKGYNRGIFISDTLYLNKGDVITIWKESGSANSGRVNFCLLTSNYNPTIVSADSVYSENEQMIGYWTDGKPLYQKTIVGTSQPNINVWGSGYEIGASVDTIVKVSGRLVLINNTGTYTGNVTVPTVNNDDSIIYVGTNNNHSSLPNRVGIRVGKTEYTSRPISITVQYTKTTDAANSLQIENSLLLNRPDLWEVGTEYHFGGGLYGQRFTGNLSTTTTTAWAVVDSSSHWKNTTFKIFGIGGTIIRTGSGNAHAPFPYNDGTGLYQPFFGDSSGSKFMIQHKDGTSSTNPYDVWVTYKK